MLGQRSSQNIRKKLQEHFSGIFFVAFWDLHWKFALAAPVFTTNHYAVYSSNFWIYLKRI